MFYPTRTDAKGPFGVQDAISCVGRIPLSYTCSIFYAVYIRRMSGVITGQQISEYMLTQVDPTGIMRSFISSTPITICGVPSSAGRHTTNL